MPDSLRSPVGHKIQRLVIALVGATLVGMSFSGLFQPGYIIGLIGFSPERAPGPYQLAEVRAVYGGLFAVIGIFTMLSAVDPVAHRGRLVALGWCWLGLAGGRLLGAALDGPIGLQGWAFVLIEVVAGLAVLACTPSAAHTGDPEA